MSYNNLASIRQQMAALWKEAQSYDVTISDVLPEEMSSQISALAELDQTKRYIKEVEEREQILISQAVEQSAKIEELERAAEDIPVDTQQALQENQMLQRRVEFYQQLHKDAESKAYATALKYEAERSKVQFCTAKDKQIADLTREIESMQSLVMTTLTENKSIKLEQDFSYTKHSLEIAEKEAQLQEVQEQLRDVNKLSEDYTKQSEDAIDSSFGIVSELAVETKNASDQLARTSAKLAAQEAQHNEMIVAYVTEAKVLRHFFAQAQQIQTMYQTFIQQTIAGAKIHKESKEFARLVEDAGHQVEYVKLFKDAHTETAMDEVRAELAGMADTAITMYQSLTTPEEIGVASLDAVEKKPDMMSWFRNRVGKGKGAAKNRK